MDILGITDIHNNTKRYKKILSEEPEADLMVLGGDLTNFGTVDQARSIVERGKDHSSRVLAVAGNCDSAAIDHLLSEQNISLHAEGKRIDDFGFFGVSAMPIWNNTMYEFSEEEIDTYLSTGHSQIEDAPQKILVSHTPPRGSGVDETRSGEAVGSTSVADWVEKTSPLLVLSGHVHEARGFTSNESTIVNCGPAKDGSYVRVSISTSNSVSVEMKQV